MTPRKRSLRQTGNPRATVAEMDQWRATIRDLPPVRTEKIRRSRAAVRRSEYDQDEVTDAMVERLREELGL